jgi:hypothetical protein
MPKTLPTILYVTDVSYPANGRVYGQEDIDLMADLRHHFVVASCHPSQATRLLDRFDGVVVRNTGPVINDPEAYVEFRTAAFAADATVFNELTGKADMIGKQYLIDLTRAGFPVIPTFDASGDIGDLAAGAVGSDSDAAERADGGGAPGLVLKPRMGSDSIGMSTLTLGELTALRAKEPEALAGQLVQPLVEFRYEVSFYFVDRTLQYALNAPHRDQRWNLQPYEPTDDDREFAQRFVEWNDIEHGIQRVDACRTVSGDLLLMELEDLNPYLSLDVVDADTRQRFVAAMISSIEALLRSAS